MAKILHEVIFTLKRKIISAAMLAVVVAALALTWYFQRQAPQPAQESTTIAAEDNTSYQFLLKTQKQSLELFHLREGNWKKLAEFPITLGDLPESDRQLLQTGLVLRDSQELQRSLEDYLPNS